MATSVSISRVLRRTWFSDRAFELALERPEGFCFSAGQAVRLAAGGQARDYTLVSGLEDPELALCVRYWGPRVGSFSSALAQLPPGAELQLAGPLGYFTYQDQGRPAVFVATGTGIAPFVAMARSGVRGFTLLHGAHAAEDLYYRELLRPASGRYRACLSVAPPSPKPEIFVGRVTAYLAQELPRQSADFYLCGHQEMIGEAMALIDAEFPESRVYAEAFF